MELTPEMQQFDALWKSGDKAEAKVLAIEYVEDNRGIFSEAFGGLGIPQVVSFIDAYRIQGKEADRIAADMWLLSEFEPQRIKGQLGVTPNAGQQGG